MGNQKERVNHEGMNEERREDNESYKKCFFV